MGGSEGEIGAEGLALAWYVCISVSTLCLTLGELTGDTSWVDRLWSILPTTYCWLFFCMGGWKNVRVILMVLLSTVWGCRLTYNFWRKGGYTLSGEDYRWPVLKERVITTRLGWFFFNLTFISAFQNALLLLIALPVYSVAEAGEQPLNAVDAIATILLITGLVFEAIADEQQWDFQEKKKAWRARVGDPLKNAREKMAAHKVKETDGDEEDFKRGFLTRGLFQFSRHPNFFCEQMIWCSFYLFVVAATGEMVDLLSGSGCVLLILLFQGSTRFTEQLSVEKYPVYRFYQKNTSMLFPWPSPRLTVKA